MLVLAGLLPLSSGSAHAQSLLDPLSFHFDSPTYVVHESDGQAVITVVRDPLESDGAAQIRYIALGDGYDNTTGALRQCPPFGTCTAVSPDDFTYEKGELDFQPGDISLTFSVPVVDHGADTVPKTIQLSLFGPSTGTLGTPSHATLSILNDEPALPRTPLNPLGLATAPRGGNPLAGADFFVNPESEVARDSKQYPGLSVIAREPGTQRFGSFTLSSPYTPDIATGVSRYLGHAAMLEPGTVPLLATYRIVYGHCGNWADPPSEVQSYQDFISGLAHGIGSYRAVLFLEMDSIITSPCLSPHGLAVRMAELSYAIDQLTTNDPHLVVYLDAGAADALQARDAANLLKRAGIAKIQGFFLNSTHFDWTSREIRYGEQISKMTGGKHFVINTGSNGRGPLKPPDPVHQGNEVLCNPQGRGLGPKPTTHTGYPNVDMFAWTTNPGESLGPCGKGAPPTGAYWPAYGLQLVRNADFRVR